MIFYEFSIETIRQEVKIESGKFCKGWMIGLKNRRKLLQYCINRRKELSPRLWVEEREPDHFGADTME